MSIFQTSYHSTVINIPEPVFIDFLNSTYEHRNNGLSISTHRAYTMWAWMVSMMAIGGLIGSLLSPLMAERLGRKLTLMVISNVIAVGASVLMAICRVCSSYEILAAGRFLIGVSVGISSAILPVYLTECSPLQYRGHMGILQNVFMSSAALLALIVAIPETWGTPDGMPYFLGLGLLPAAAQIFFSLFQAESPKFLYINRRDTIEAERSLRFWSIVSDRQSQRSRRSVGVIDAARAPSEEASAETPMDEYVKETFREYETEIVSTKQDEIVFIRAIKQPHYRRIYVIAIVLSICQASTASSTLYSYSADMFLKLGFSTTAVNACIAMLTVINTAASLLVSPFIERYSRRHLYFGSYALIYACFLMFTIFSISYEHTGRAWPAYAAMACMFVYYACLSAGPTSLTWILPAELSPQAIRSSVNSIGSATSWILILFCNFFYPPCRVAIGAYSYLVFFLPLSAGLAYLYKVMPETGGKRTSEIWRSGK